MRQFERKFRQVCVAVHKMQKQKQQITKCNKESQTKSRGVGINNNKDKEFATQK